MFDQECEISSSSFIYGRGFVIHTFLESSCFWVSFLFTKKTDILQRQFNRQGFGYPGQHLKKGRKKHYDLTATRGSRTPSWTRSSPWTSLPCPTTPLSQRSSRSSGSKRGPLGPSSARPRQAGSSRWSLPSTTGRASSTPRWSPGGPQSTPFQL